MKPPKIIRANRPDHAGQPASSYILFGEFKRYCVQAFYTRFDKVAWFVTDAETTDDLGLPAVIRQADTFEQAVQGF